MNKTMAGAILLFRSSVSTFASRAFSDIEALYGRDVLNLHYNKIMRLLQICSEGSKFVGIEVPDLVDTTLGALAFALKHDLVKPSDVNVGFLDSVREGRGPRVTAGPSPGGHWVRRASHRATFVHAAFGMRAR